MSGPKGGAYHVETAEQREARMLRDAKAAYAGAESRWQDVVSRRAVLLQVAGSAPACERPAPPSAHADSTAYTAAAQALQAATEQAATALSAAREEAAQSAHAAQVAGLVESVQAQAQPTTTHRASRWESTRPQTPEPAAVDRDRVNERLGRRIRDLATLDHDPTRVQELVADIKRAGSETRIDLLLNELDLVITGSRAATARREAVAATRAELTAMRARLAEVPAADALRDRISALIAADATAVPDDLIAAVDAAVAQADAEADRQHVVRVMHRALQELGYVVGPQFSTDLSGANAALARNGSSHYGVKVRLEPGSNRFTAQAVRSDAVITTADEDAAAERVFCDALDKMVELAKRDGVDLDVDLRHAPGAYAVQKVADDKLVKPSAARAAKPAEKRRTL
ncbi:hypothetical protein H7J88_19325 [Mycolicibacterium flavescens]|uniref:Uncharacterized protein n=1 Tax=Mycolicibacterium flavescens TaxID=1776 RepID=A0A1E3RN55_MYCFV|nr:hypothetical protein [Mycolicibacterium flavescens]MCV7281784.1 hypothetical protein [Mycolicibacterium flavescens]ODQ90827.1 hypothetical protein BHQ18_08895 [Mycolicibacterium flavescens]